MSHNDDYQSNYRSYDQPSKHQVEIMGSMERLFQDLLLHTPVRLDRLLHAHFQDILPTPILHPNLHPNPLLHFLLTTTHTVTAIIHVDQAQSNLVALPPLFLQDMFPSTFKTARKMNGLVTSVMPCTTQTECVQQMNLTVLTSVHNHPCPSNRHTTMQAMEQLHQVDQRIPGDIAKEGSATVLQYWSSSRLRSLHLPRPGTSSNQHACTRPAFT